MGQLPICIEGDSGNANEPHSFDAPLVGGTGKGLPAILGFRTTKCKHCVVQTKDDGETLSFPGPGGYEIKQVVARRPGHQA